MPKSSSSSSWSSSQSVSDQRDKSQNEDSKKSDEPQNIKIDLMRNQQNEDLKNKEEDSEQSNWYELRLKPNPTDKLPNRWGHHASFIHEGRLYIFGGNDIKEGTMDSMWMINLAHFADLEKPDHMQNKICKWAEWETSGKHPGKVAYHTINVIGDTAYLIGGSNEVSENEHVYTLYMNSFEWRIFNLVGEGPGAIE